MVKTLKSNYIKLKSNSFNDIDTIDDINKKTFFTKKKIIIFLLFFVMTIILFSCAIIFIFKTNIPSLMIQIKFGLITRSRRI